MRGLTDVSFIYLDESDSFPVGQQQDANVDIAKGMSKYNPRSFLILYSTILGVMDNDLESSLMPNRALYLSSRIICQSNPSPLDIGSFIMSASKNPLIQFESTCQFRSRLIYFLRGSTANAN